jgi:hypothetical protein
MRNFVFLGDGRFAPPELAIAAAIHIMERNDASPGLRE